MQMIPTISWQTDPSHHHQWWTSYSPQQGTTKDRVSNGLVTNWSISTSFLTQKSHIDGLVQDCSNSSALALELLQSCAKPSIYQCSSTRLWYLQYISNGGTMSYTKPLIYNQWVSYISSSEVTIWKGHSHWGLSANCGVHGSLTKEIPHLALSNCCTTVSWVSSSEVTIWKVHTGGLVQDCGNSS